MYKIQFLSCIQTYIFVRSYRVKIYHILLDTRQNHLWQKHCMLFSHQFLNQLVQLIFQVYLSFWKTGSKIMEEHSVVGYVLLRLNHEEHSLFTYLWKCTSVLQMPSLFTFIILIQYSCGTKEIATQTRLIKIINP